MLRGEGSTAPESLLPESESLSAPPRRLTRLARLGCAVLASLFLANCANDQVARRGGKSKEIGAFSHAKYGTASPRVIAEGQDVPKGGGRQLIGRSYAVAGKRYTPYDKPIGYSAVGMASWYGEAFHGRRTANGEIYDRHGISAAHPTMPLPAYARVTNTLNQRSIIVRVNDRGPFHGGRIMDLSQSAADALAFRHLGTARVKLEYLGQASLAGSDDKLLLATLRTDGQPAAIPGTRAPTQVASASAVASSRYANPDLDETPAEPSRREIVSEPVAQAYAAPAAAEPARTSAISAPAVAAVTPSVPSAGVPVRGAPVPPSRPFDLDTIANAGTPVIVRSVAPAPRPVPRNTVASLFAAPERSPSERFAKDHPLSRDLAPQRLQPLSRN